MKTLTSPRRSLGYLLLYALAYGGGVVAYVPLLTLLLPVKVELLAGADKIAVLSAATLAGAIAASLANIAGGMISDRSMDRPAGRRPWVWVGLAGTVTSYGVLHLANSAATVIAGVVLFQLALNFMLAPLLAIAADEAPDGQKGLVGGLFGAVYPLGALSGVLVTWSPGIGEGMQFAIVCALIVGLIAPFLVLKSRREPVEAVDEVVAGRRASGWRNLTLVWLARLLLQMAGIILFAYLLYYFETVDHGIAVESLPGRIALLSGITAVLVVPLAPALGRLSDVTGSRKLILAGTAGMTTLGLAVMALLPDWPSAAVGYMLFCCGSSVFLSIQNTYAMQLLPSRRNRGRDLGILNLTNTIPAMAATMMAFWLIRADDFTPLLIVLAGLTALGGVLMLFVRDRRDAAG